MTEQEMIVLRTDEILASLGGTALKSTTYPKKLLELSDRFRDIGHSEGVETCELLAAFATKYKV